MRRPVAWSVILPVALAQFALLIATANRYGYHRDELYFIQAGKHPAFGYDDQPPLTPLLGRLSAAVFGESPRGLRTFSALAAACVVIMVALIARELGAGRRGQLVAAAGAAMSLALFVGHLLSTTTFDLLFWIAIAWIVVHMVARGDPRWWLAVGAVSGIALQNKHLVLLLLASLALGFAVGGGRELLRSRWLVLGALIAVAIWSPNLVWQARHGWPQLELADKISGEDRLGNRTALIPFQLAAVAPFLTPVWIAGLWRLLRDEAARPFRFIGCGYVALLGISIVTAAKPYYTAGLLLVVFAAGCVPLERWLDRHRWGSGLLVAGVGVSAVLAVLLALPVVPVDDVHATPVPTVNEDAIETIGWPQLVQRVAEVRAALPADRRSGAVIFTANYGEAGAIDRFGPALGLSRAYSGHNSYARWGIPPGSTGPVIVLGYDQRGLAGRFIGCRVSATVDNGVDLDNEEQGRPIWTCDAPARPWAELWPELRHLSP